MSKNIKTAHVFLLIGFILAASAQGANKEEKDSLSQQEYNYLKYKPQGFHENEMLREEVSSTISPVKIVFTAVAILGFGASLFYFKKMPKRIFNKHSKPTTSITGAPPLGAMIHEYVVNKSNNINSHLRINNLIETSSIIPTDNTPSIIMPYSQPLNMNQLKFFLRQYPGLTYSTKDNDYNGETVYYFDISNLDPEAQKSFNLQLQFLSDYPQTTCESKIENE